MNGIADIRKLRRALLGLALVIPAVYIVFALGFIALDYRATLSRTESDVGNISATLAEHAMRTIGEADSRLQAAITAIERAGLSLAGPDESAVHAILHRYGERLPQVFALHAVDADGRVRASGIGFPLKPIDARDREFYRYHLAHADTDLHISRPVRNREDGRWAIPLSRRVNNPDGSMKMIIIFGIDLSYFDRFYRTLRVGEHGVLTLARQDGWLLMVSPLDTHALATSFADAPLLAHARRAAAGTYQVERSALDNTALIVGFTNATQYPIVAAVSMSRDYVLGPWHDRIREIVLVGLFSVFMLEALLLALWRRLHELVAARESLARQNEALDVSRRRYQELVDGIDGIVWEATLPGVRFTYVSGNAEAISGYPAARWLADPRFWQDRLGGDAVPPDAPAAPGPDGRSAVLPPVEHHVRAPDGREIWLRSNLTFTAAGSAPARVRGVTIDVTAQKMSEQRLYEVTHFDPLTRLPNRFTLLDRIDQALALAARTGGWVAAILIDLDQFKTINDSLGHDVGDRTICGVADRLRAALRPSDFLARLGGDEFVLIVEEFGNNAHEIERLVERISRSFDMPVVIDGRELYVGFSMGISLFPEDASDLDSLRRHADTALHRAKAAGRNCWRFFDESMSRQVTRRLEIETAMRRAVEREEFQLVFQPQQSLQTGRIVGVETLLRWQRGDGGPVAPPEFLPLAEEDGQIVPLGAWILQSSCAQAVRWRAQHDMDLRLAVNVAARQIHSADFVAQVQRTLDTTGLPPHRLELELTESSIIGDIHDTVCKLQQLKALGIEVAIDDFGTGYSSLAYLKDLPIDRLKIDQSFIRNIPASPDSCAIVRTIIVMAKTLGLAVIAEGVETQAQVDFLRDEGCGEIQGYFLSRPLPADALIRTYGHGAPQPDMNTTATPGRRGAAG
jgi:diguanylate cyclase (GGDEF)-like protein